MKGEATIAEIISKYQVSKSVLHKWKKQFLDNGENIFKDKNQQAVKENHDIEKLHATIGS